LADWTEETPRHHLFSPLEPENVISWLQKFAFKWVNVSRYAAAATLTVLEKMGDKVAPHVADLARALG
jgi:hypothetical protein